MNPEGLLAIYGYPLKDPAAACHACGALGTVGRAIRKLGERETFHAQYCAACWPTESKRLSAQWDAATNAWLTDAIHSTDSIAPSLLSHAQSAMGAATWDGVEAFLRDHLLPAQQSASPRSRAELGAIAAQYVQLEKEYVGAMPPLVADFIQQYVAPPRATEPDAAT
ncbi:MAG: hypothetical protein IT353_15070 [Gemmatimonadaceae bacterium]|nr:hypothetical protein [Gemmatimonadaceae bacterium]